MRDLVRPEDAEGLHAVRTDPLVHSEGYVMTTPPPHLGASRALVARDVADRAAGWLAYTVRLTGVVGLGATGTVLGTTSLGDLDVANEQAHLGWTMYGSRWWGTAVNPDCPSSTSGPGCARLSNGGSSSTADLRRRALLSAGRGRAGSQPTGYRTRLARPPVGAHCGSQTVSTLTTTTAARTPEPATHGSRKMKLTAPSAATAAHNHSSSTARRWP